MRVLAIDPGADGGMAYFDNRILTIHKKLPNLSIKSNVHSLLQELTCHKPDLVVIEEQTFGGKRFAGQRNGQKALFGQGMNYGRILTLLLVSNLEFIEIPNAAWTHKVPICETPAEIKQLQESKRLILESKIRSLSFAMSIGAFVIGPKGGLQDGIADAVSMGSLYVSNKLDIKYYPKDWKVA